MTDSSDYRKYLDVRFEAMQTAQHAYFREMHDRFDTIDKSNKVRNGRIDKLENSVSALSIKEAEHVVNCPVAPKFDKLNEELTEYRMLRKYPKIAIGIIVFCVLSAIYGFMKITHKQDNLKAQLDLVNTPVQTERGIRLYPSGIL